VFAHSLFNFPSTTIVLHFALCDALAPHSVINRQTGNVGLQRLIISQHFRTIVKQQHVPKRTKKRASTPHHTRATINNRSHVFPPKLHHRVPSPQYMLRHDSFDIPLRPCVPHNYPVRSPHQISPPGSLYLPRLCAIPRHDHNVHHRHTDLISTYCCWGEEDSTVQSTQGRAQVDGQDLLRQHIAVLVHIVDSQDGLLGTV
jgi:hypothetical protein